MDFVMTYVFPVIIGLCCVGLCLLIGILVREAVAQGPLAVFIWGVLASAIVAGLFGFLANALMFDSEYTSAVTRLRHRNSK